MPRKKTPKRPKPIKSEPLRARAKRGPHPEHSDRWYWEARRCRAGERKTVWCGWASREEAIHVLV